MNQLPEFLANHPILTAAWLAVAGAVVWTFMQGSRGGQRLTPAEATRLINSENAVVLDGLGNVAELATANIWMAKDGAAHTPIANGTFLNGITRQRVGKLLAKDGIPVYERVISVEELLDADEIFSSGNYGKVMPITRLDERVEAHGVTMIGYTNLPSQVPAHASQMYAKNLLTFLDHLLDEENRLIVDRDDEITAGTLVTHGGEIVNDVVRERLTGEAS